MGVRGQRRRNIITAGKGYPLTPDEYYKLQAEFLLDTEIAKHLGCTRQHFERYKKKFDLLNLKKEENPYLAERVIDLANQGICKSSVAIMLRMDGSMLDRILEAQDLTDLHFGKYYVPYSPLHYYKLKSQGKNEKEIVAEWGISKNTLYTWKKKTGVIIGKQCRIMTEEEWYDLYQKEIAKTRKACS